MFIFIGWLCVKTRPLRRGEAAIGLEGETEEGGAGGCEKARAREREEPRKKKKKFFRGTGKVRLEKVKFSQPEL